LNNILKGIITLYPFSNHSIVFSDLPVSFSLPLSNSEEEAFSSRLVLVFSQTLRTKKDYVKKCVMENTLVI